jgi:hypothetical protein
MADAIIEGSDQWKEGASDGSTPFAGAAISDSCLCMIVFMPKGA